MLNRYIYLMLVFLFTQSAWGHTFDIGVFSIPGACVISDYPNRANFPFQNQKSTLIQRDGQQKHSVIVLPSKADIAQSPDELAVLEQCVVSVARSMPKEVVNSNSESEEKIKNRINACLINARAKFDVQFASVRKESIKCPNEGTQ
jgi:hypothetical protein